MQYHPHWTNQLAPSGTKRGLTAGVWTKFAPEALPNNVLTFVSAIPFFTGKIIDSVTLDTDQAQFNKYMVYLLATGFVTGIFTAVRGSTFIVVGARFGIRMRKLLYASLLRQDIAFYDATKTGNITSRLSSDTDKVAGQVELNINVMARSMLQVTRIAGRRDGRALARRAGHRHVAPHCRR